ncbi:MAG: hypothetical protein Q9224_006154, partial [Gallowayella concinna]
IPKTLHQIKTYENTRTTFGLVERVVDDIKAAAQGPKNWKSLLFFKQEYRRLRERLTDELEKHIDCETQ